MCRLTYVAGSLQHKRVFSINRCNRQGCGFTHQNGKQVNAYLHRHYSDYFLGQNEVSTLLHILKLKKGLEENLTKFQLLKSRGENKFCYLTTIPSGVM
jgi:hypothetical protein